MSDLAQRPHLAPGDVVRCGACGAEAVARFTSPNWQPGYPVCLEWTNGPHPRTFISHHPTDRCPWCYEAGAVLGDGKPSPAVLAARSGAQPAPGAPQGLESTAPRAAVFSRASDALPGQLALL